MKIKQILAQTEHRPWKIPEESWMYYQEWNHVLFLHWEVEPELIKELLPKGIELDLFQQKAWISLVPFTMQRIRPSFLPDFAPISNFHEVNLRTYVKRDGKSGVYFFQIESEKWISTCLAKKLSGLPYEKAQIKRKIKGEDQFYQLRNNAKGFRFSTHFKTKSRTTPKNPLELWLTERYCLYVEQGPHCYRYDIHHVEWQLDQVELTDLNANYNIADFSLSSAPNLCHYSPGVQVLAWKKTLLF